MANKQFSSGGGGGSSIPGYRPRSTAPVQSAPKPFGVKPYTQPGLVGAGAGAVPQKSFGTSGSTGALSSGTKTGATGGSGGTYAASSGGGSGGGGGGGGGGGSSTTGYGSSAGINAPLTGWASGLKPDMLNTLMVENPDAFLRQIMHQMGLDPDQNIGAFYAASPYIRNMNELALLMLGGNDDFSAGDLNSAFNWMGNFASQGMTPGGDYINFDQGLSNLMHASATGGTSQNSSPGSGLDALSSYLTNNNPQGQVDSFMSLLLPLANASLHPLWARALQNEASRVGDAWVSKSAGNDMPGAFNTFFKQRFGL